jgi:long-chain acyl-CoA synthetase
MNTQRPWLSGYPEGVPADVDVNAYASLTGLMRDSFQRFSDRTAFTFMGRGMTYAEMDALSQAFAAYLKGLGLAKGDRVAVMMPNVLQYPVVVAAILRAGFVVVNVNPLYTSRELLSQLKDSGSKAIVILENFAAVLQKCLAETPVQHIVMCTMGDRLGALKGTLVNYVVRRVKKMVPAYHLPQAVPFNQALKAGAGQPWIDPELHGDDLAVLQYTGGTTGVAKGAELLHRNLVANMLQSEAWFKPALQKQDPSQATVFICALPLYHIFAFTVNMLFVLRIGGHSVLIPNPRDIPALLTELSKHRFHVFPAVNTLFNAIGHHADVNKVDWSSLKLSLGGGMAVQEPVAKLWQKITGNSIIEGYGLSETSPIASANPVTSTQFTGDIGLPFPNTEMCIINDEGQPMPPGEPGEIAIRGPQVMAGYWQRPDETDRVMTADGFFRTGDVGVMDANGRFKIVDRKKDMILVSGFNVYPNEVEEVVASHPGVLECAVIGTPDEHSGEAVKLVVVRSDPSLNETELREHCKRNLTGYKQPKHIEFRTELPKTPVGKVLRRELRDAA